MKTNIWIKLVAIFIILNSAYGYMGKEHTLKGKNLMIFAPELLNPDNFSFEFGFTTDKKIKRFNYHYNAFGRAFIAGESHCSDEDRRSAALGGKLGLILPTQPWIPIYLETAFGFAKTALQKKPWFGKSDDTIENKDMFLGEASLIYLYKEKIIYRVSYQVNNVDYFTREVFFSIGGNY